MTSEQIDKILLAPPGQLMAYSTGLLQGTAYSRLHNLMSRSLFPYKLSIPEWKLLGQLYENEKIRLAELAELLSYDPPMVTKLAKMLEKKGLVQRMQDEHDERAKVIHITQDGSTLVKEIEPAIKKVLADALNGVAYEDLRAYIRVLAAIVKNT